MSILQDDQDLAAIFQRDSEEQHHMLMGFWMGGAIYGIYAVLFAFSLRITQKNPSARTRSAKIFLAGTFAMFIMTTIFIAINVRRFLYAFSPKYTAASEGKLPIYHLRDYAAWDGYAIIVLTDLLIWLADALAIYRCYLVWSFNIYAVILPLLLFVMSVVVNGLLLGFLHNPNFIGYVRIRVILDMAYPINIAQSTVTTALIAWKIWRQHRASTKAGLQVTVGVNLLTVIRIIVESAMIFTVQQILLLGLYLSRNTAEFVVHGTAIPSIGIVFVLIAIRTYTAKKDVAAAVVTPEWIGKSSMVIAGRPMGKSGESTTMDMIGMDSLDSSIRMRSRHSHKRATSVPASTRSSRRSSDGPHDDGITKEGRLDV